MAETAPMSLAAQTGTLDGVSRVPLPVGVHGVETVNVYLFADGDRVCRTSTPLPAGGSTRSLQCHE